MDYHSRIQVKYKGTPRPYLKPKDVCVAGKPKGGHLNKRLNHEHWKALMCLPDREVREIVLRALPREAREFRTCLWRFVRALKSLDGDSNPLAWQDVLKVWFFRAQPVGKQYRWDWTREKFAEYWKLTKAQRPDADLAKSVRKAIRPTDGVTRRITSAMMALSKKFGNVFFASVRSLAEWCGSSHATIARHLARLVAAGSIVEVTKGNPHPYERNATTFDVSPLFTVGERINTIGSEKPLPCLCALRKTVRTLTPKSTTATSSGGRYLFLCLTRDDELENEGQMVPPIDSDPVYNDKPPQPAEEWCPF